MGRSVTRKRHTARVSSAVFSTISKLPLPMLVLPWSVSLSQE